MPELVTRTEELLVMEQSYRGGSEAPPPHYHPAQDEHFEVLEGTIAATIDGEERLYTAGESFDVPRETVHAMRSHDGPARVRWEVRPAGRTWEFISSMPSEPREQLAHVQRYADVVRLVGV